MTIDYIWECYVSNWNSCLVLEEKRITDIWIWTLWCFVISQLDLREARSLQPPVSSAYTTAYYELCEKPMDMLTHTFPIVPALVFKGTSLQSLLSYWSHGHHAQSSHSGHSSSFWYNLWAEPKLSEATEETAVYS